MEKDSLDRQAHRVEEILRKLGVPFYSKRHRGEEDAISIQTPGGLRIWVYEDGGELHRDKLDIRFEIYDYENLDSLFADLRDQLGEVLRLPSTADDDT